MISRLKELEALGAPIEISSSACEGVFSGALDMLVGRSFVDIDQGLIRANPDMYPMLKYYANSIVHWQQEVAAKEKPTALKKEPVY